LIEDLIDIEYLPFPVAKWDDFLDMMSRICDEDMKVSGPLNEKPKPRAPRRSYTDSAVGY